MRAKNFIFFIPVILIFIALILLYAKIERRFGGENIASKNFYASSMVGKKLPELNERDLFNPKIQINNANITGKYALVNVFASWCVTCLEEHKYLKKIAENKKFVLVGINWRDEEIDAKNWLKKNGNPYNFVAFDNQGKFGISLGISGIPETFLVNPEGKIIMSVKGNITDEFIEEAIKKTK